MRDLDQTQELTAIESQIEIEAQFYTSEEIAYRETMIASHDDSERIEANRRELGVTQRLAAIEEVA